ncbi:hypothetical protein HDG34_005825 [Paraburkholderia sp. HC6.4b]|uniref:hypothetical protein n=1 Tax=unclassified Paraburkholderia TaxID=2615204 RepID=UPI00161D0CB9|nr:MULTISPECIES: hypothetical protein [unclassified Paraburkholderia]MBB5411859.1 hypothetical protein [Paraburkholderia sp. HC6.4b]MBB5450171.1 hypothetical protein [Paraburkholderia sp. Kb1A]
MTSFRDLLPNQQYALLECARFRPGTYVYKPKTMEKLCGLGLTYQAQGNSFCLTQDGEELVRAMKDGNRK